MKRVGSSFRDPDGYCFQYEDRILRVVRPHAADRVRALIASTHFARWIADGDIPTTRILSAADAAVVLGSSDDLASLVLNGAPVLLLEQERIPFVSYAHEWPPEMLYAAGELTLKLQLSALEHGLMLKDATPSNILFIGTKPVFVDILSFVPRPTGSAIWPAYAQFVRTFVLPLLVHRKRGIQTHRVFLSRRDGLEPREVYARLSWVDRFSFTALKTVLMPTWLARTRSAQRATPSKIPAMAEERAAAIAPMLVRALGRSFRAVRPRAQQSTWSDYTATNTYDAEAVRVKEQFVRDALRRWAPRTVLDVGCNTGQFSRLAVACGASVVAIDYDSTVVGRVFANGVSENAPILPLVVNLAWPTPALGWNGGEMCGFLSRAEGSFDAALLLAVIHHITVTDGVPLEEVFRAISRLVTKGAIVEFIPPSDSQFQIISRNKEHLVARLSQEAFECALARWFDVARRTTIARTGRALYELHRKNIGCPPDSAV